MHALGIAQVFPTLTLAAYTFLALAGTADAQFQIGTGNGQTQYSRFGDVIVSITAKSWRCDRIFCPTGTDRCEVKKYKSPKNPTQLIRENKCLNAKKSPLVSKRFIDSIQKDQYDDLDLVITSTGTTLVNNIGSGSIRKLTPQESKELENKIKTDIAKGQETLRMNLEKAREG